MGAEGISVHKLLWMNKFDNNKNIYLIQDKRDLSVIQICVIPTD